ncbi:hypothetical protein ASE14_07620 [Agromyces sp. Root81]|uniref:hypothetical protein n=1 Tax=Agromyces sp. Root81 TaxID=1736601 RepID=UPI0006FE5027|nr:hypothetical protein [Agromyces sp. Root81]KRC60831.1 hypothetical protein ASE14_07620 [Agromyces sp. Root81]
MTDHTPQAPEASESGARRPLLRRPQFWLVVGGAILAVIVAFVVGAVIGGAGTGSSGGSTPTPGNTDAAATPPASSAPASRPPSAHEIPTDCEAIYTRDWSEDFAPLVLNPAWALEPGSGVQFGSNDRTAVDLLTTNSAITCNWGGPAGGSDRGLTTNIAHVTEEQAVAMLAHFGAMGYSCYEELEGTRCVTETPESADGQSGESHFIREGVWIATLWMNAGPDGYTNDIVAAIFG